MNDSSLDKVLQSHNDHIQIVSDVGDSTWGQLIIPARSKEQSESTNGLKIVAFASYINGYLLFETLQKFAEKNPNNLEIKALVTDDPVSPDAKISIKRRIWRLYGEKETISLEAAMVESALVKNIPVYTGAVKTDFFRKLLKEWNPDAILVCVFGQIIDTPIIDFPKYGIYNFHPSDLAAGHGAGPRPLVDLIERNAETSKLTIHQLTETVDSGFIIGQSTPINVRLKNGIISDNILVLLDKLQYPTDVMGAELIKTLILKKEKGKEGYVDKLDLSKHFTETYKKKLMEPIQSDVPSDTLPEPSEFVNYSI